MALVGSARPGKGGLGYTPRAKQQKNNRPRPRVGVAGPGKPGVGKNNPKFAKPGFAKGVGKPKPGVAKKPMVAQPAAPDSTYNDAVDLAGRKEERRLTELGGQEEAVKREFGIEDPTDPFSRANALKSAFLTRQKAASAGLASQGQLYSGAHERSLSRTRREEEEARHGLRQAYEGAIGAIGAEKAGVKFATEEERAQAFEDWLARAPEADVAEEELEPEIEAAANAPEAPAAANAGPVLVGQGPQVGGTAAERARIAHRAVRKSTIIRARAAERRAKKAAEEGKKPKADKAPIASINRPGAKPKARPKAKPKARKKGRR